MYARRLCDGGCAQFLRFNVFVCCEATREKLDKFLATTIVMDCVLFLFSLHLIGQI